MAALLEELKSLSLDDRARLAQALWDSVVEEQSELPLDDEHHAELERRLADPNPQHISWEEAKARLRNR